jgi:hypothetical protein
MKIHESFIRKQDGRCLQCFALERERAHVAPHEMLRLVASVATATGVREEFTCGTCGQRMVRFVAKQINPPPADVWRAERASARIVPAVVDAQVDSIEGRIVEPDSEDETTDESGPPAAAVYERGSSHTPPVL